MDCMTLLYICYGLYVLKCIHNYINVICLCSWQHSWCAIPSTVPTAVGKKHHDAWWDWGSTEHRVHHLSLNLHLCFHVPKTCSKSNQHRPKLGQFEIEHFIVYEEANHVTEDWIYAPVSPFTCFHCSLLVMNAFVSNDCDEMVSNGFSLTDTYSPLWPNVGELMQEILFLLVISSDVCLWSCQCRASKLWALQHQIDGWYPRI